MPPCRRTGSSEIMKYLLLVLLFFSLPARAALDPAAVKQLAADDSDAKIAAIQQLGASGDPDALKVLKALADDALFSTPGWPRVSDAGGQGLRRGNGAKRSTLCRKITSPLPSTIGSGPNCSNAIAGLRLMNPDRVVRLAAAKELQSNAGIELAPTLERALAKETDGENQAPAQVRPCPSQSGQPGRGGASGRRKGTGDDASANTKGLLLPLTQPANEARCPSARGRPRPRSRRSSHAWPWAIHWARSLPGCPWAASCY